MALPKILVFGHSHMGALLTAARGEAANGALPFELVPYQFLREDRPHIVSIAGKWQYHPGHLEEIRDRIASDKPALIIAMMQGDQALSAGLIMPDPPFEFHFPGEAQDIATEAPVLPFDMLLEACEREYWLLAELLGQLQPALAAPALALSPPPPVGDAGFILAHKIAHAGIGDYIRQHGLPPARWRRRMWRLYTTALRRVYERHGFRFIGPPREAFGPDGCLAAPFRSDVFHANARYGSLLLRLLQSRLTGEA